MKVKQWMAAFLTVCILPSMYVPVRAESNANPSPQTLPIISSGSSDDGSTYDMSQVYTDYLYKHSTKSSNNLTDEEMEKVPKEVGNANDDSVYSDFGFKPSNNTDGSGASMEKTAEDLLNKTEDDALDGFNFILPEELIVEHINGKNGHGEDDHTGGIRTIDNVSQDMMAGLSSIGMLKDSAKEISVDYRKGKNSYDIKEQQSANCIAIDYDNDGVDELAEYVLCVKSDNHSYGIMNLYDRKEDAKGVLSEEWTLTDSQSFELEDDNNLLDMEAQYSKGYTSMTAGDFDGDGYQELAIYLMGGDSEDSYLPRLAIVDIRPNGTIQRTVFLYLEDIRKEYNNLKKGSHAYQKWQSPVVALSTTKIRSNTYDNLDKDSNKKYTDNPSYEDLVVNISIPRTYDDDEVNMNSVVAIYSYDPERAYDKYQIAYIDELNYGDYRMIFNNSVDADLNGDGYDELVVAGLCENDIDPEDAESSGSISKTENLVQIISWFGNDENGGYKAVWEQAQRIEAAGGGDDSVKVTVGGCMEPIALTAGRYVSSTPVTLDYLCVQGVIFSCEGAKLYGKNARDDDYYATFGGAVQLLTMPFHDDLNYAKATFKKQYKFNLQDNHGADAHSKDPFISTAASGVFYNATSGVETIVMLTGDTASSNNDLLNYDIAFVFHDGNNWVSHVDNDYIHHSDEDDGGTSLSLAFGNTDKDEMYYKLKNKTLGYSSPTLYSVVQAPPYYAENNASGTSISYTITHSHGTGNMMTGGMGLNVTFGGGAPGVFQTSLTAALNMVASKTWKDDISVSTTLKLPINQDQVVVFAIPIVSYLYDVWVPAEDGSGEGTWEEQVVVKQLTPSFTNLSVEEYNELVADLDSKEQREAAPPITALPPSRAGDPSGYAQSSDAFAQAVSESNIAKKSDIENAMKDTAARSLVSNKALAYQNDFSFTKSTDERIGFNVAFSYRLSFSFAEFLSIGGGADANLGYQRITTNGDGVKLSVSYGGLQSQNPIAIDGNNNRYDNLSIASTVNHYNYVDYVYNAQAVAYASSTLTNDIDMSKLYDEDDIEYERNKVYVLSYYVTDVGQYPPEQPRDFVLRSATAAKDENGNVIEGEYDVVLQWNVKNRSEVRKAEAYNIYKKDINDQKYTLLNTEGPIVPNANTDFVAYTVKGMTKQNYTLYLVPAYSNSNINKDGKVGGITIHEAIISQSARLDVNIANMTNNQGIVIDKQPTDFGIKEIGQEAEFTVVAHDSALANLSDSTLKYSWEIFDTAKNTYVNVSDNLSKEPNTYRFVTTQSNFNKPIRCRITKSTSGSNTYSLNTDSAMVILETEHRFDENGFCPCGQYQPAVLNSNGVYEISNAGQLYWFAALVNGDTTHADGFTERKADASAVLTKDITVNRNVLTADKILSKNADKFRKWIPIGQTEQNCFSGSFDGQGHTISGLYFDDENSTGGLIGNTGIANNRVLEVGNVMIKDSYFKGKQVGGIVGYNDNERMKVSNCMVDVYG